MQGGMHGASLEFGHSPVLRRAQPPQQAFAGMYHKVAHTRLLGHSLDERAQLVIAVRIVHACRSVDCSCGAVETIHRAISRHPPCAGAGQCQ